MLKVAGVPFIAHQIGYAKAHGITRIVVATSYKTEQFLDYLGDGSDFGIEIAHAIEVEPLGTGGAIANASTLLESASTEPVVILNGDVLSAHDVSAQLGVHQEHEADATLHLIHVADARPYGSVPTHSDGRILQFVEKSENPPTQFINAGCYIFTRSILDHIPQGKVVSVERETFPNLLAQGARLWGYKSESYWLDIGTPSALLKASTDLITGVFQSPAFDRSHVASNALIDGEAEVDARAVITAGSSVGSARIESDVQIINSVIGDGAVVESGAQISHSIIGDKVRIGLGAVVERAVIAGSELEVAANSRQFGDIHDIRI